jgi:hypothetical protein
VLFPGGATLDKLIRHGTEKPPSVRDVRPEVPEEVAAIVAKLLAKHPSERYQTPTELAAALEPFAVSGPTPWAPLPPVVEPFEDALPTPGVEPTNDAAFQASDELSALANTLAQDGAPTPLTGGPTTRKSGRVRARVRRKSRWRLWLFLVGMALVLGLTAAAGALLLLAGNHIPIPWR